MTSRRLADAIQSAEQSLKDDAPKRAELDASFVQNLADSGFIEKLKEFCNERINSEGVEEVDLQAVLDDLTPKARGLLPDSVKQQLLRQVREQMKQIVQKKGLL
jgi:enhancer of yellow 2 transcription factor